MITRSQLKRGTAYAGFNGHTFEVRDRIKLLKAPKWDKVLTSQFGAVDVVKTDNVIELELLLWGAWENLGDIFPSYLMNPIPGTDVFGSSDLPLTIQARNSDLITVVNAAVTGMAGLYLGVDSDLFAAAVKFTGLIGNGLEPEAASSYTTIGTNAYSAATEAFAKTNFKRTRFGFAWGTLAGFGGDGGAAMRPQKGAKISWGVETAPVPMDGYGTVNMSVKNMIAQCTMIPVGPTMAQVKAQSNEESAMGTLGSSISADLVGTGNGGAPVVTLKSAYMKSTETDFDPVELRVNEITWESTKGFSTGAPAVTASVA